MSVADWLGSLGVGLILLAYFLQTFNYLHNHSRFFYLLNGTGALLACYASWLIHYWPFVVLEGTWAAVSIYGIAKANR